MPRIQLLPDRLVSQIAAGEVVERPASVAKELLENALDAGASRVVVELAGGGRTLVRVEDDGSGMEREDALLSFDRHATSKISTFEDLERVATLGFRGEALAAIAAVSRIEMTTAVAAGEGCRVRIEGGRVRGVDALSRPSGTTVEVRSLFFNVPARRRFLKSSPTELRRCLEVAQGYALSRPRVGFGVQHEGRTLLDLPPSGDGAPAARRRIAQVFGGGVAEGLVDLPSAGGIGWGFVGRRATARARRAFVFVNGRLLRDRAVLATFYRAVREVWKSDEFPDLFLALELPPAEVDANVHPQKAEVRFRDPRFLDGLGEVLRSGLEGARQEAAVPLRSPAAHRFGAWPWGGATAKGVPGAGQPAPASGAGEVHEGPGGRVQTSLVGVDYPPWEARPVPLSGGARHRPMRLLAQYKGSLILLEGPEGLYLVDQHAAHERVLYERLRRALETRRPEAQGLLEPRLLELAPAERLRLAQLAAELERHGFSLRELSGGTLALSAAPAVLDGETAERLLLALAAEEGEGTGTDALSRRLLDAHAAGLACRAAVKIHHPLGAAEMQALVGELLAAQQPYACPHGRPTILEMRDSDLERRFGRR